MKLKIVNWNISYMRSISRKIDHLKTILDENTVFVLEEVRKKEYEYIIENVENFQTIFSLNLREKGKYEGKNRELGVLIGYSKNFTLNKYNLLEDVPFPERTIYANFSLGNFDFGIIGFHSLTGCGYSKTKSAQFASIASYIYENEKDIDFLCFDANEPEIDHYDISKIQFFSQQGDKGHSANLIMGDKKVHELNDAYREFLKSKKDKGITKEIPLATSYILSGKKNKRYDYIFSSKKWNVTNFEYKLEEGLSAGSDHAIVLGEFSS